MATYCVEPGCRQKVERGRCRTHTLQHEATDRRTRGTSTERGYDSRWRRVRKRKLRTDPLCEPCMKRDRTTAATEVDHITPLSSGGARLEWSNLQSICRSCHAQKTARERDA